MAGGPGWKVVEVYEAESGGRRRGSPFLQVETVLARLGAPALWSFTGRRFPAGRFAVALGGAWSSGALVEGHRGVLDDGSGLAYEVLGDVAEGEDPQENYVYVFVPGEDSPGGAGRRVLVLLGEAEREGLPSPVRSDGRLRCPACGRSEGFSAYESYVHKLALDEDGNAVDDDLGAGGDGVRLSTCCDSCGHEWREDGDAEAEAVVSAVKTDRDGEVLGALGAALGALEYAAHKDQESDLVYGDADAYWADGGEGDRAISGVLGGIRLLGGHVGASRSAGGEPETRIFVGLDTSSQDHSDPLGSVVVFPLRYPQAFCDDLDEEEPEVEVRDDEGMTGYAERNYDFWSIRIFGADGSYRALPEDAAGEPQGPAGGPSGEGA